MREEAPLAPGCYRCSKQVGELFKDTMPAELLTVEENYTLIKLTDEGQRVLDVLDWFT